MPLCDVVGVTIILLSSALHHRVIHWAVQFRVCHRLVYVRRKAKFGRPQHSLKTQISLVLRSPAAAVCGVHIPIDHDIICLKLCTTQETALNYKVGVRYGTGASSGLFLFALSLVLPTVIRLSTALGRSPSAGLRLNSNSILLWVSYSWSLFNDTHDIN